MRIKPQESEVFVIRAETDQLKNEAYRLRYSVFSIELGDHRYADHSKQLWSDSDDIPDSNLFVAVDNLDQVVGSIRLTAYREHEFIAAEQYRFSRLADMLRLPLGELLNRVARADRVVLAQCVRGTNVLSKLQECIESYAKSMGLDILVAAIGESNERSRTSFGKLGWNLTDLTGEHSGFKGHIIYKLLGSLGDPSKLAFLLHFVITQVL